MVLPLRLRQDGRSLDRESATETHNELPQAGRPLLLSQDDSRVAPLTHYRCGHCGCPGPVGRCTTCGSAMDDEDRAIETGDKVLIRRWLASRDRAWEIVEELKRERGDPPRMMADPP